MCIHYIFGLDLHRSFQCTAVYDYEPYRFLVMASCSKIYRTVKTCTFRTSFKCQHEIRRKFKLSKQRICYSLPYLIIVSISMKVSLYSFSLTYGWFSVVEQLLPLPDKGAGRVMYGLERRLGESRYTQEDCFEGSGEGSVIGIVRA